MHFKRMYGPYYLCRIGPQTAIHPSILFVPFTSLSSFLPSLQVCKYFMNFNFMTLWIINWSTSHKGTVAPNTNYDTTWPGRQAWNNTAVSVCLETGSTNNDHHNNNDDVSTTVIPTIDSIASLTDCSMHWIDIGGTVDSACQCINFIIYMRKPHLRSGGAVSC